MGPLCPCPHSKKPIKGTRGISWGPLLTPGPRAVPEFPNGQSTPGGDTSLKLNFTKKENSACLPPPR
ncbi:unnamed protein product [Staurois parvus]|uniref:Uncharacterized protein n=1 Tax=Staurois parvus TaxID=386267 RepID=A0ABN9C6E9_9NEOB|nr:unnamed protein product [Staurois parvus]